MDEKLSHTLPLKNTLEEVLNNSSPPDACFVPLLVKVLLSSKA